MDCVSYPQWWVNYVFKNRVGICIFGCLNRFKGDMSITLRLIGAGVGLASSLYGVHKSAVEAKKQEQELARQRAANEAWYNRNYYQDYLNTVQAQNALKQYRNAWAERTKEARARQAISGGTPEQAQAVAEAGGEAMGNMIGNLAAKGEQSKAAIDAQKLAMDNNLSQQQAAIAEARQQAASNLMSSGASMLASSLPDVIEGAKGLKMPKKVTSTPTADTAPGMEKAVAAGRETRINPTSYDNPIVTPEPVQTQEQKNITGLTARGYDVKPSVSRPEYQNNIAPKPEAVAKALLPEGAVGEVDDPRYGTMREYKGSYGTAFKQAEKNGEKYFWWNNKPYAVK